MTKTVKELANELGVTKQAIQYHYQKLPANYHQKNVKGNIEITSEAEQLIRNNVANKRRKIVGKETTKTDLFADKQGTTNKALSTVLERELKYLKETSSQQINAKDKQIERLQKLLDQSQQLQLMAENKIKQLENKTIDEQERKGSSEEPVQTSNVEDTVAKAEHGFWSRLFNK